MYKMMQKYIQKVSYIQQKMTKKQELENACAYINTVYQFLCDTSSWNLTGDGASKLIERLIMPSKELALADIDFIFLAYDKLEVTVTPRSLMVSTRSKALWSNMYT